MADLLSWAGKQLQGAVSQINPFDGGADYNSVVNKKRKRPQQVVQRPQAVAPPAQPKPQNNVVDDVFKAGRDVLKTVTDYHSPQNAAKVGQGIAKVGKDVVNGIVEAPKVIGTGAAHALNAVNGNLDRRNQAYQRSNQQDINTIRTLGQKMRQTANPIERDRIRKSIGTISKLGDQEYQRNQLMNNQTIKAVDPVKNAAAIGQVGFDVATMGVGTGGVQAAKLAAKQGGKALARNLAVQGAKSGAIAAPSGALGAYVTNGQNTTASDVAKGAGAAFVLGGAIPAASYGVVKAAPIVARGARQVVNTAPKYTQQARTAIEQINPQVKELDSAYANMQRMFDNTSHAPSRQAYNKAMALNRQQRQALTEGGYFGLGKNDGIPKELHSLADEARKYKSAEEFVKAKTNQYHGTLDKEFNLDPKRRLFLTGDADSASTYAGRRYNQEPTGKVAGFYAKDGKTLDLNSSAIREKYVREVLGQDKKLKQYYDKIPENIRNDYYDTLDWVMSENKAGRISRSELDNYTKAQQNYKNISSKDVYANWDKIVARAKKDGYDYIKHTTEDPSAEITFPETVAINPSKSLLSDKQLTDLYNEAIAPQPKSSPIGKDVRPEAPQVGKTDPLESLKAEARKYGSAEEFVDSKINSYHQTDAKFDKFENTNQPFRFSGANFFLDTKPPKTIKKYLVEANTNLKNPLVIEDGNITQPMVDKAIKDGYDGIINKLPEGNGFPKRNEIAVFNPETIQTRQQLTDLWNEAISSGVPASSPKVNQYLPKPEQPKLPTKSNNSQSLQQADPLHNIPQSPVRSTLDNNVGQSGGKASLKSVYPIRDNVLVSGDQVQAPAARLASNEPKLVPADRQLAGKITDAATTDSVAKNTAKVNKYLPKPEAISSDAPSRQAYNKAMALNRQQRQALTEGGYFGLGKNDGIPKELHSLADEARKYNSAEEFVNDKTKNRLFHGTSRGFKQFGINAETKQARQETASLLEERGILVNSGKIENGALHIPKDAQERIAKIDAEIESIRRRPNLMPESVKEKGVYLTNDENYAQTFAGKDGKIIEADVDLKNPYIIKDKAGMDLIENAAYYPDIIKNLEAQGFDSIKAPDGQVLVFDPQKARVATLSRQQLTDLWNEAISSGVPVSSPKVSQHLPKPEQPKLPTKSNNSQSLQQHQIPDNTRQSHVRSTLDNNAPQGAHVAPPESPSQTQLQRHSQTADTPSNPLNTIIFDPMDKIHAMNPDVPVMSAPSRSVPHDVSRPSSAYPAPLSSSGRKTSQSQKTLQNRTTNTQRYLESPALFPYSNSTPIKLNQKGGNKNIPVRQMTREGDVVTGVNINKNIKSKETRFSVDDEGKLIEDKKGAYRIFTNGEGRVNGFRVGNKYFDSKELGDLSDVNDYGSALATMRRNIERGFGKETSDKVSRFLVDHQQAQATKLIERQLALKDGIQQVTKDLGIDFSLGRGRAKKISAAIQDYGEKARNKQSLIDEFGKEQADKIVRADKWFRTQYDSLLNEANVVLKEYGYDPIPKRENYYTHFQEPTLWQKFGLKMNEIRNLADPTMQDAMPDSTRGKINNKLAGQSEFTQPNKRFNPFALKREGNMHTSDAFGAFERYLNPTLNNIYMTPSISRARVLSKAIAQDADVVGKDANKIIIQTKEWANRLAGKSARADRPIVDSNWGQKYLKASRWAQTKAGQNTIVGNLSTAVMQPIVLGQTAGKFGYKNTILGGLQLIENIGKKSPIDESSFMKRRYADLSSVTASAMDKSRDVANTPLRMVEETAARITWNAAHNDALSKGIKGKEAIRYADIQAEKTLAGRSIGEKPEIFDTKSLGPLTMYQLEVSNFWQQFAKEMTRAQAAKTMVATYGINLLLQEVSGRQVGFNPVDAAIDSYQESQKDKPIEDKIKKITQRLGGEVVDNLPFAGQALTTLIGDDKYRELLGSDSQGGRFGVSSPLRTLVDNPAFAVSPFGGSQVKKTIQGFGAVNSGNITDKNGKTLVNIPQTPENYIKGALFGKSAIPEVNQYYNNIGKKKIDQTIVDNQTDSKAYRMGRPTESSKSGSKVETYADKYSKALKDYKENSNKWSVIKKVQEEQQLNRLKVQKDFDNDTVSLYGMSKKDVYNIVTNNKDGNKFIDNILRYGDAMVAAGIYTKNKFRDKYGNVKLTSGSSGGKRSGRKGGGKGSKSTGVASLNAILKASRAVKAPKPPKVAKAKTPKMGKTSLAKYKPTKKVSQRKAAIPAPKKPKFV